LACFLSAWGLLILTPIYVTAAGPYDYSNNYDSLTNTTTIFAENQQGWQRCTIFNVVNGNQDMKNRLVWIGSDYFGVGITFDMFRHK
jgi:hypothetical protein